MAVRNILNRLSDGDDTVTDTYYSTEPIAWSGASAVPINGTVTFIKVNDLCLILLSPINMTTVANATDLVGSVIVPYVLKP